MQFKELSGFQQELLIELSSGRGLQGLIDKISTYCRKPIIVMNSSTRVLASSLKIQPEEEFIEILESNQEKNRMSLIWNDQKLEGLVFPVESNNLKLGSLLILDACPTEDFIIEIGKQAALSCAVEIVKQNELLLFEQQYKEAFIYELLYGNIEYNQDIISQGEIWGWNLEYPHGVIVFELEEYEQYSSDFQLVKILLDIVSIKLGKIGRKPILLRKKGEIVVLLTIEEANLQERRTLIEMFVKKVMNKAEEKVAPRIVRVGVGRIYDNPNEIFRSYQEAKVALELGRLLNMRLTIPCFGDLGLARILYNHDYQELQDFYQETLGDLEKYDKEQGSELLNSLEKYLLHRCELKTAADALFLHPNTLRYRLKKIEEILSIDLNEFDIKLNLMAAFKIKYLKKV
jgi:sugar diacid utilization regulator